MKKQSFILGVALLLGGTSCIKDWHKPPATVTVSTFAGKNVWGTADGVGTAASFFLPSGIATDAADNLYVTDNGSGLIRKVTPQAVVTTLAGSGKSESYSDGQGSAASFWFPEGIAVDASGYIYVGDSHNNRIRKITPTGLVTTFAGSGVQAHADGIGTAASFYNPSGVALDASGNIYVADLSNYKIRKITPDGVVTTFAGSGAMGAADGKGTMASFNLPIDVATDAKGNIYVADQNNKIRKITPEGVVSTLAGSGAQGDADGKGAAASFYDPTGIGLDASGNIYVADYGNNKIRKVTQQGVVTTLAGTGVFGSDNGSGASATFKGPHDVAVDSYGRIFVVEATDIRLIEIK